MDIESVVNDPSNDFGPGFMSCTNSVLSPSSRPSDKTPTNCSASGQLLTSCLKFKDALSLKGPH